MIIVNFGNRPNGLSDEIKNGWQTGVTQDNYRFVHCSTIDVSDVGLDPLSSREWVMDNNRIPILGGRLVFAFPCLGNGRPQIPPPVRIFGMANYMYVFTVPRGIQYACQGGNFGGGQVALRTGMEVAFPYRILGYELQTYQINLNPIQNAPQQQGRQACCTIL